MSGTMTNPMKEIFIFSMENRFSNVPVILFYLFVGYMFAEKLFSNYPDKELLFSSGCYDSFLSDFPLWRGRGL